MDETVRKVNWPLGVVGAVLGGVAGYFVFRWIAGQGFYALILPGATVGLGCGVLSRGRSHALGVVCGLLAVPVGLLAEWRLEPFVADESLGYFLKHLHQLQPITIIMIVVGTALAYWMGVGSARRMDDKSHQRKPWLNHRLRKEGLFQASSPPLPNARSTKFSLGSWPALWSARLLPPMRLRQVYWRGWRMDGNGSYP